MTDMKAIASKIISKTNEQEHKEEVVKKEEPKKEEPKKEEAKKEDKKSKKEVVPDKSFAEKRAEKLKAHIGAIVKSFGNGSIHVASASGYKEVPRISSGVLNLDYALGGGWARSRISVLSGEWSSCKTRLAISAIADAQQRSVINSKYLFEDMPEEERVPFCCLYIDAEGTLSPSWVEQCGVDLNTLHLARPTSQEEATEILVSATSSGAYDLIILDSLAQLMTGGDIEAAMDEKSFGTQAAKKNNTALRKCQALMNEMEKRGETPPTVLIVNQLRDKIGGFGYGPPKKTRPGGVGQEYVSTMIVEMWPGKVEYFDDEKKFPAKIAFGFYVDKNKVNTPKMEGEFIMAVAASPNGDFSQGEILEGKTLWDYCERFGIISKVDDAKWSFKGAMFKTKKEIYSRFFQDKKDFLILKREVLDILCPKK